MRYLMVVIALAGCAHTGSISPGMPVVDMSPVGCGYKWFQSGHAQLACDAAPDMQKQDKDALAKANAWQIARERCPLECPPVELIDPAPSPPRPQSNVCHSGIIYYQQRVFFQCQPSRG